MNHYVIRYACRNISAGKQSGKNYLDLINGSGDLLSAAAVGLANPFLRLLCFFNFKSFICFIYCLSFHSSTYISDNIYQLKFVINIY